MFGVEDRIREFQCLNIEVVDVRSCRMTCLEELCVCQRVEGGMEYVGCRGGTVRGRDGFESSESYAFLVAWTTQALAQLVTTSERGASVF